MTATANHGHSIFCCTIIMHGRHHRMKMLPVLVGHRTRLSVQQNKDKSHVPLAVILLAISGAVINKLAPLTSHVASFPAFYQGEYSVDCNKCPSSQ